MLTNLALEIIKKITMLVMNYMIENPKGYTDSGLSRWFVRLPMNWIKGIEPYLYNPNKSIIHTM